jgi:uncharacterized protein (DUF1800 family)
MVPFWRRVVVLSCIAALCLPAAIAHKKDGIARANARARALEALNRLTFGPRPGEVDRVLEIGVDKWMDQQLHPESIEDHGLEARLAPLRTLQMSPRQLAENFPPNAIVREIAEGKESLPRDPKKRAIYEAQLERYRIRQEKKSADGNDASMLPVDAISDENRSGLLGLLPDERIPALLRLTPQEQIAFLAGLKGTARDEFFAGLAPDERETAMAIQNPQQLVSQELMDGKILRATYSERQLEEVMTDFWFNHFNVFIGKGADRYELPSYERDIIRPHALGKFEDLLVRTAQSPAMLFYLDNWLSVGPDSDFALGVRPGQRRRQRFPAAPGIPKQRRNGLNENYGRELMELHTLGVNGGYTQKDVTEVAKVFTGWTLKQPRQGGGFEFDQGRHEPGTKIVLGHKIKENGEREGYEVLHLLAHHPATARFICNKIAMRFVSDNPPPALVDRMAKVFLKKDGDIREVLQAMLGSPEFWAPEAYRAKVKTPLEFVVSALRATGAEINDATPIARQLQQLGMPLYGAQPPTGYAMKAQAWVNSSALLGRMNFAVRLASGHVRGVQIALPQAPGDHTWDAQQVLAWLENSLLEGEVSEQTHETITAQFNDPAISQRKLDDAAVPPNVAAIEGLLLGSPEFQKR